MIADEKMLEELLSRPTPDVVKLIANLDGDFLFLGIAGKIGPSLAGMAKRACFKGREVSSRINI
jgi:hypothetical protein